MVASGARATDTLGGIAATSQCNAAVVEEVLASTAELVGSAQQVTASALHLRQITGTLTAETAKVKLASDYRVSTERMGEMAYIKLTSKLRRMLDDLDRHMRRSGFRADLRWLEESQGMCPLCGETGGRPGTISMVQVAEAGMIYIPYTLCERCVERHFDFEQGGVGPENRGIIEERIFSALGIARQPNYRDKVPAEFRVFFDVVMKNAFEDGIGFNPTWLQYHTDTCPACGRSGIEPAKSGISLTFTPMGPTIIPYLVCTDCARYTDEQLNLLVAERLLQAVGLVPRSPA